MSRHKWADIIHAWAEGAEIQLKVNDGYDKAWIDLETNNPIFYPTNEYRIKPKTIKREGWVNIFRSPIGMSVVAAPIFELKEDAEDSKPSGWIATIEIEWEEFL